jgi:hypothetical protein
VLVYVIDIERKVAIFVLHGERVEVLSTCVGVERVFRNYIFLYSSQHLAFAVSDIKGDQYAPRMVGL